MKYLCSFLFILIFKNSVYSQVENSYDVFALNDTFSSAQPAGSTIDPQKYQLTTLKGFKLNCANYDFSLIRTLNDGKNPDAIFIVSESGNYIIDLNINGETIVDASTMKCIDDPNKEFKKFKKGDTPIMGIGTLKIIDGNANMLTFWISMIDVK